MTFLILKKWLMSEVPCGAQQCSPPWLPEPRATEVFLGWAVYTLLL